MLPLAFGFGGPWDVAIVAGVVIVLFGTTKIPTLFKSLGEGIKEFKSATKEDEPVTPAAPTAKEVPLVVGAKTEETNGR